MWFAAPRHLNDPYDIRTPLQFDVTEIENPIFFEKLKAHYLTDHPSIAFTERDLNVICENKMDEIRKDPQKYFENNYKQIREGKIYDRVGVFSCTKDELNETMWANYANNNQGFAIGFITVELARNLSCSIGPVTYKDTIPVYSFINPNADDDFDAYFLKSKKWEHEQEFRFYTIGDDENIERAKKYPINCAAELLLGYQFPEKQKEDIIKEAKGIFGSAFPIFQVRPKTTSYGLDKLQIA